MTTLVHVYLSDLERQLHLERPERRRILYELKHHIEDSAQELIDEGINSDDAFSYAITDLGEPKSLARRFYEVHSQGSWYHTALAVLPHVLLSLLFALGWWRAPLWLSGMLIGTVLISVWGWKRGRPAWTYPWLGYSIIAPIVSWGLAMSALGYGTWGMLTKGVLPLGIPIYVGSFVYLAASLWVIVRIISRVARFDWIMASLTVLPLPFIVYWTHYFYTHNRSIPLDTQSLHGVNATAAIVFLVMAIATVLFLGIGRRVVRAGVLFVAAAATAALAWVSYLGGSGYVGLFTFSAVSFMILLSPAIFGLQRRAAPSYASVLE